MQKKALLIPVILFGLVCTVIAQDRIKITVDAEKTEFLLGEPVIVYVTLTNMSAETVQVSTEIQPEVDICYYLITDPDGKTRPFSPVIVSEPEDNKTLAQNESVRGSARIFYGGEGYYFPKPGKYKVVVSYEDFKSEPLELKVLAPQNEAEREQSRLILDHTEVGLFLTLEGGDEFEDAMTQMEVLTTKYPNSILTAYVLYAQAKNLSVPARNFVSKKPRDANFPEAIKILDALKDKDLPLFYQIRVISTLAYSLEKMDRNDEAKRVYQEFQKKLELNQRIRPYLIDKIVKELKRLQ